MVRIPRTGLDVWRDQILNVCQRLRGPGTVDLPVPGANQPNRSAELSGPRIQVELLYLAPTTSGRYPISETALRRIANLLSWIDQRREWTALKQRHRLA